MNILMKRHNISFFKAIIIFSLYFVVLQNIAFWHAAFEIILFESWRDYFFVLLLFIFLFAVLITLFCLILWSKLTIPMLILLILLGAAFNYFSFHYKIFMDREMLTNIIETNTAEVVDLLSIKMVIWMFIFGVLPIFFLTRIKVHHVSLRKTSLQRLLLIVSSFAIISMIALGFYKDFASFIRNNKPIVKLVMPNSLFASSISYAKQNYQANYPFIPLGEDATLSLDAQSKKQLFIVVVGETARSQNFSLNGYGQKTNPLLEKVNNLFSFQNVDSCGTATAISVPCMFSKLNRSDFDKKIAENQDNVFDIVQRAGYQVLWRENDNGCKGVCNRIPTQMVSDYIKTKPASNGFYYDEYLLTGLDEYIQDQSDDRIVIVLHMNGSHGPTYYQRYPENFKVFTPTCDTNRIETCDTETLVNTYDNTILYTDYVLNQTIELLKKYDGQYETMMMYVSDHGESLGEKGIYLHGTPYMIAPKEQTSIPLIFWGNDEFYKNRGLTLSCIQKKAQQENYSHDNIFHTLLGLLQVQTKEYDPKLNIFTEC